VCLKDAKFPLIRCFGGIMSPSASASSAVRTAGAVTTAVYIGIVMGRIHVPENVTVSVHRNSRLTIRVHVTLVHVQAVSGAWEYSDGCLLLLQDCGRMAWPISELPG
jgi:hypothetical protein